MERVASVWTAPARPARCFDRRVKVSAAADRRHSSYVTGVGLQGRRVSWRLFLSALRARRRNGGGQFFDVVAGEGFDCNARGPREPEGINQPLHAPLVYPIIDGLPRYAADPANGSWPAREPDGRGDEIRPADPGSSRARTLFVVRHVSTLTSRRPQGQMRDIAILFLLSRHSRTTLTTVTRRWFPQKLSGRAGTVGA